MYNDLLQEFKDTFFPESFNWRKGQKEAIQKILKAYDDGYKNVILDAPTGSGKSLVAMCVSWILNKKNKEGYMLASDITLQEQYEKDFKNFNLNWGSVKGIDNYICIDNGEKNSLGTCRIQNEAPRKFSCYNDCPYFSNRDKAASTPTSLLNYAYWLIMMNYVNVSGDTKEDVLFPPRDFLISDEAHKVLDIVQNHYSPIFTDDTSDKIKRLTDFFFDYNIRDHNKHHATIDNAIKDIWRTDDLNKLYELLSKIEQNLKCYLKTINVLKNSVKKEYGNQSPPKAWRKALNLSDWLKDLHCKLEDYIDIINKTNVSKIIKNPKGKDKIVFNCLQENYLMHKYFHKWSNFTIFISATIADPTEFAKGMAIKTTKYIKVSNNFDFSNSPIYYFNKRKMSRRYIDENLPWLYDKIIEVSKNHVGESGIVHTASYDLAMKIYENVDKHTRQRMLIYNGTQEKKQILEYLKQSKDKILVGPSLLEGLDLKDNWSRFNIFAKVPYLSLGDAFVKAKLNINPGWYKWKAIINLLQGVGRSVRNENDWAITYILDASLSDLIHNNRKSFPKEFMQRIRVVNE